MFKGLKYFILFLISLFSIGVNASMVASLKAPTSQIIKSYELIHKKFSKYSCGKGEDSQYEKLFKTYKSQKYSIPIINDTTLDVDAIRSILPEFPKKIEWIKGEIRALRAKGNITSQSYVSYRINKVIDDLLVIKEHYNRSTNAMLREQYKLQSQKLMIRLRDEFELMISQIPFFKNYSFPVDHLKMRKDYDYYRQFSDIDSQKKKNVIYLQRKMVEDGAHGVDSKNGDIYLRSFINTLALRLQLDLDILPEDIRYDLKLVVEKIDSILNLGYQEQITRMEEWEKRVEAAESFYKTLLDSYLNNPLEREKTNLMLKKMAHARFVLEDYVLKRQDLVYKFWFNQTELNKALFVMDTILINEVGAYDYEDGLEKRDILQVIINRKDLKEYNSISENEPLFKYLNFTNAKKIEKESWLNLLFKSGEFSFTYYYIPETVRLFCPDMSRPAKKLRLKNLNLAINQLKHPNFSFDAIRYFSRVSMLGGIDAGHLWSGFRPLTERVGSIIINNKKLLKAYKTGKYKYLYTFENENRVKYDVLEIEDNVYLLNIHDNSKYTFYKYRNPHYFRYFRKQ